MIGTDIVAHHRQGEIRDHLRQEWQQTDGGGSVAATGAGAGAAAKAQPVRGDHGAVTAVAPSLGQAYALVEIPRLGADYAVPLLQGVQSEELARGIGHFPHSAGPGEVGNFALAGHRVTHGSPFRDMPSLRPGDKIIIETRDAFYTYVLDTNPNDLNVDFHQTWVVNPVPVPPPGEAPPGMPHLQPGKPTKKLITITTCAEFFHTDNRLVAFGHLQSVRPK